MISWYASLVAFVCGWSIVDAVTSAETDDAIKRIRSAVEQLGEHFDCVHILVSHCDESGTWIYDYGSGNFYARLEMARHFIRRDEGYDNARLIAHEIKNNDAD